MLDIKLVLYYNMSMANRENRKTEQLKSLLKGGKGGFVLFHLLFAKTPAF